MLKNVKKSAPGMFSNISFYLIIWLSLALLFFLIAGDVIVIWEKNDADMKVALSFVGVFCFGIAMVPYAGK